MELKKIDFEAWKEFCRGHIKDYVMGHDIYQPDEDGPFDDPIEINKVPREQEIDYVEGLHRYILCGAFLMGVHNGEESLSESGQHFFETYYDALSEWMGQELFDRLCAVNGLRKGMEGYGEEWIYSILAEFTKEKVLGILEEKHRK